MLKKVIISICTTVVLSIVGVASVVDIGNKEVKSDTENQNTLNETNAISDVVETKASNESEELPEQNTKESQSSSEQNTLKQENTNTKETKTNNTNQSKEEKEDGKTIVKNATKDSTKNSSSNKGKQEESSKVTNNQETITNKEELNKPKEKITYNDTATKRLIQDIDDIAKKNKSLWGENLEKRYKIKISSSLVGGSYMCPYRKAQVEGIVLNSYPVTFLVYAVTYQKIGYQDEVRYYISVTNY